MNRKILSLIAFLVPVLVFAQLPAGSQKPIVADTIQFEDTTHVVNPDEDLPPVDLAQSDLSDLETPLNVAANSRDPFFQAAVFNFSAARFRLRGYDSKNFTTVVNGVPFEDLETGRTPTGLWSGLNTMFRNRENTLGIQPNANGYSEPGGLFSINARASKQRKQFQISYSNNNRIARNNLTASYSTGLMKNGWAVSAAISRRWANEGYVAGTFYDGTSYYLAAEKRFGTAHALSLTAFGASVHDGKAAAATQEMFDLAGSHYYNSNWGWQDGKKRNAVQGNNFQPTFILTHDWKINKHETMTTSASFTFGKRERTSLDFYNAAVPQPDYYRYLPSYIEDSTQRILATEELRTHPELMQINWAGLYDANAMSYDSVNNANGGGTTVYGKRARYIVQKYVNDTRKFNLGSTYNNTINSHITVSTGLVYQFERVEYYKVVDDLLGADFYVNVNQFAERDFPDSFNVAQNDLNHPNRILHQGDKFGYDYFITNHRANLWGQSVFKYGNVNFFVAADFALNSYWRTGMTRYGLQPDNSYGKSAVKIFPNGGVKAGVTYKVDGRNSLYLNGAFESRAPLALDAFISAPTQNSFNANLQSSMVYSGEVGYILHTPNVNLKADMYFTQFDNETQLRRFYHSDYRTFVNYSLTGINTRHWGGELGLEAKIWRGFSITGAASMGRYTYTSRPTATITYDNAPSLSSVEKVYSKNFNVGGTPQLATTVGIRYRAPQFWYANVNFNYYDWMWSTFNPAQRTESAVDLVDPTSPNFANIVDQQRLKGQFTMNVSVGYSWLINNQFKGLKKRYFIVFSASANNITNNKNMITTANEQLRFDYFEKNVNKFPPRYAYGYGATYNVSIAFRMQ